jgi:hypothetical protein
MPPYHLQDILASYRWLGHQGFTELNAYHRDYEPGPENFDWNLKHNLFPIVGYTRSEHGVAGFVRKHHAYRMLCYGLNPRPRMFTNDNRRPRSAREHEIQISQNLLIDIDVASKQPSEGQIAELGDTLTRAEDYFLDQGFMAPVRAFTGRGYHLLFAFPEIKVSECPDIASRLRQFSEGFKSAYGRELADFDARVDSTHDLRRMVKMYGSAKPQVGIISKFYSGERLEDERLRTYLLGLESREERKIALRLDAGELPPWFETVLQKDARTRELWSGAGKLAGDTSRSGYDYSLVLRLMGLGHTDICDLATILALRPEGAVQKSGKGDSYIRHTIANAILRPQAPGPRRQAG